MKKHYLTAAEPACLIRAVGSHVNQAIVRYDMANSATPR
ncbi:hypothetical protein T4B_9727 [Trichinella pseudospiralis]|uniref:Uncharacterized protein n=1 Tax=Trichinella pseudospiralis TaxID=6337 RepID=A0A0V1GHT3_TRIPS|nr:hypothetical protein T4B_9727 [Trichinella pseudospiralis]KRY97841.1 hypothetical protein T4C_9204 [Trichinella pseudospiralis]